MAAQRAGGPRPQDFTGSQKAKLAKEHAEEVARRGDELAMLEASMAEAAERQVIDHTGPEVVVLEPDEVEVLDDVQVAEAPTRIVRVLVDCAPTIGAGNHYDFKEGQKVRVPAHVAAHLEEKGLAAV